MKKKENKEVKLLGCPFCGGKAELVRLKRFALSDECYVRCVECNCHTDADYDTEDNVNGAESNVIKLWNIRKPTEAVVEEIHKYFISEMHKETESENEECFVPSEAVKALTKYNADVSEIVQKCGNSPMSEK